VNPVARLAGAVRARFQRWLAARLPASDTCQLTQRNIYIVPTKAGFAFALTLLLMLVASINYQLNLGYVLTFLLAGAGVVSMHLTHGTLRGLTLHVRPVPAVFAGEAALLEVVIGNAGGLRHALAVHWQGAPVGDRGVSWCDVPAQGQEVVHLSLVPAQRGWHALPLLVVTTVFPFGLFRAWTVWRPASRLLAWPRPETPAPPLPPASAAPGEPAQAQRATGTEFEGVRAYRRGDSMRQVVWKKVARTGQLVSRETSAAAAQDLWLDWSTAPAADAERRLSRLAAWVQSAERAGLRYGLRLPGRELAPGQGELHRRAALDALATH
jgi:uncharacterized protein (DUF58 family)